MPFKKYSLNVFINCPFDDGFKPIFESIIFTVVDCGFIPRCAKENGDSDVVRIKKIETIIEDCKYGIHDISMAELDSTSKLARFNMPFELGLFLGCKSFGANEQKEKSCLILDKERYRYQKFISDIAGQDIRQADSPETAIRRVREFLSSKTKRKTIPSSAIMWTRFQQFSADLPISAKGMKWDSAELTFIEYYTVIRSWLKVNAP